MDQGKGLRAYIVSPGDGSAWSMRIVIVGPAAEAIWPENDIPPPSPRQRDAADAWTRRREIAHDRRKADLTIAFRRMPRDYEPLPKGATRRCPPMREEGSMNGGTMCRRC